MLETKTCDHSSENYGSLILDGAVYLIRYESILVESAGYKISKSKHYLNSINLILEVLQNSHLYVGNTFIIYKKSAFRHPMKLGMSNIMIQ